MCYKYQRVYGKCQCCSQQITVSMVKDNVFIVNIKLLQARLTGTNRFTGG